jgi:PAS domain S-box-containing protein
MSKGDGDFLAGNSEMAALIRSRDWTDSALGPIEQWPQSLRTTVSLCLASNFPINIIWGADNSQIYNDGYRVVCGDAHPTAFGQDYRVTWASAWPAIGQPFEQARAGTTSFLENQRMFLTRNGYFEETFFTFSLSPIRDESGGIGGLFHPVTETTATMLAERRTRALRDLTARLGAAATAGDLAAWTVETLAAFDYDLPFLLFYELTPDQTAYRLAGQHGIAAGGAISPVTIPADAAAPWPFLAARDNRIAEVAGVDALLGGAVCGPYDEPPTRAFVLPIGVPGLEAPPVIVVLGVSPRLPLTEDYRGFFELIAAAISGALRTVRAREDERRRAEALAEIDRAKTAFFSNVSHEFRTPLTLMLGPLDDALGDADALPVAQRARLEVAHRNALRLLKLVNALLEFSRIEAGRVQGHFEATDLARFTEDLASNFRSACERAGIALIVDCPPLARPVPVDRDMWEKIVLNLVSNAFKFTLGGSITVRLREQGDIIALTVRDTGVGVSADEVPRLFERFHRIAGQKGRTYEGTGIGLSLVKELVGLHGGTIAATSELGVGTSFEIMLPRQTDLSADGAGETLHVSHANVFVEEALRWLPEQGVPQDTARAEDVIGAIDGRPRVLLADDNADMRTYVGRILEDGGYEVEVVENGALALAAAKRLPMPDLVLSDVMMPEMDGFALLAAIRSDAALDGLLVILLSARAGEDARVEGLAAGADDYLVKPFGARELRARVDGAIGLARQRRTAIERERELEAQIERAHARAQLQETEQQLAFALEAGGLGTWEADLVTGTIVASDICREMFGFAPDEPYTYQDMIDRIDPQDRDRRGEDIARAVANHGSLDMEYRILRPDGTQTWGMFRGRAEYADDGRPLRMAGVSLDITRRKRAEERLRLLLDELNHRVKNTLATVQSISMQTRRTSHSPAAFSEALDARISALAGAHDLLTQSSWEGAQMHDVLALTLAPYRDDAAAAGRIRIEGPALRLNPNAAVTMNMSFHELATNAAKYGALSRTGGNVAILWSADEAVSPPVITLRWTESDGPIVGEPARRGFGSRLLEQGLGRELGGDVILDYQPSGLVCTMRFPVSHKVELAA